MVLTASENSSSLLGYSHKVDRLIEKKYPKRHHHYRFSDFFTFDTKSGSVLDWNNSRNIFAGEDFIVALIEGLEEEVGSASSVVMYSMGRHWGTRDAESFKVWFEAEFGFDVKQASLPFLLETWWWPLASQGWGNWEVDLNEQKNGFVFINVFDSAVARTLGDVGKPVCHIYAGLFSGFFSELIQRQLNCIEIQCYAMGETYCKFLLGKQDRIDAATFWQTEGATARDIEKKLHNGEYLG